VALQLLHVPPTGDGHVVVELRTAARLASERGAPVIAAMLLERALAEPPNAVDRSEILLELGRAKLADGRLADSAKHLTEAHRIADDPRTRARAAAMLSMTMPGPPEDRAHIIEIVRESYDEIAPLDRELALRLHAMLVLEGAPAGDDLPAGDTIAEASFLGTLIFTRMDETARAAEIAELATRGARQAEALLAEGGFALAFTGIVLGLRWAHRLSEAEALLDRAIETAQRRGSRSDFAMAMTLRANVHRTAGRLRDAEADARAALPTELDDRWAFARGIQPLILSLLDQGRVAEATTEMRAAVTEGQPIPDSPPLIPVVLARMALKAGRREYGDALADWQDALRRVERYRRSVNAGWIEDLAVAADVHRALGDSDAARATAAEALKLAERWDTPGAIGQALHAQARVGAVDDPVPTLERAAALLAESPLRLEHAKALVTLGSSMLREGRRADSRQPLRQGYELAVSCGAEGLAEAARTELRVSGVRVRQARPSGAESLTPSEERIAAMAADGMSNAEIAQELFLTVKTVEMHLTQAYRKLDIRGRRDLAQALEA
jgi:DNA-binding CsgD family transcriptional regulator